MLTTYILGPFAALLPRRWRSRIFPSAPERLARAAVLSGILETLLAIAGLVVWYSIYVTLASHAAARSTAAVPDAIAPRIGMFAYIWFWLNPVTWLVAYFVLEGVVRYLAALATGEVYGMLPLYVVDSAWRRVRQPALRAEPPLVADEILPGGSACDLKIASCRSKADWQYPFTIRYAGSYFQVIAGVDLGVGPRPHVYSLRRLPPGEIARGLKEYQPDDILSSIAPLERIEK